MDDTTHLSTAAPAAAHRQQRRSAWPRFAVVGAAMALLVIAGAGWTAWTYFDSINRLSRGATPNVVELRTGPGRVVVYYEGRADPSPAELAVEVVGPDDAHVPVQPFAYDLRYDVGKVVGHAIGVFDAPAPGSYVVTSRIAEAGGRIAVGGDLGAATVLTVFAVIAALFTLAVAVLGAVLFALVRADSRRREN